LSSKNFLIISSVFIFIKDSIDLNNLEIAVNFIKLNLWK